MNRLLTMVVVGLLLISVGCTESKSSVAIGDVMDIPNTELKGYTVLEVAHDNVVSGANNDETVLLLSKTDPDSIWDSFCLVVQTKENTLSYVFLDGALEGTLATGDVDGDKTNEIIVQLQVAASGGAGHFLSCVFKVDETLYPLWIGGEEEDVFEEIDTGFTGESLENYEYKITNVHTKKSKIFNVKDDYSAEAFDETGKFIHMPELTCDTFFEFEPRDVDGDGICEIACSQYAWLDGHADGIGVAKTVLKFNVDTQRFEVVDSDFER